MSLGNSYFCGLAALLLAGAPAEAQMPNDVVDKVVDQFRAAITRGIGCAGGVVTRFGTSRGSTPGIELVYAYLSVAGDTCAGGMYQLSCQQLDGKQWICSPTSLRGAFV